MMWEEIDAEFRIVSNEEQTEWVVSVTTEERISCEDFIEMIPKFLRQIEEEALQNNENHSKLN